MGYLFYNYKKLHQLTTHKNNFLKRKNTVKDLFKIDDEERTIEGSLSSYFYKKWKGLIKALLFEDREILQTILTNVYNEY